jgi:uncharacterized protein (TIGR00369 family)
MNDRLNKILALPLHKFLGLTALSSDAGRGALSIAITENLINPAGIFHGGVIYVLCDVCAYGGLLSLLDEGTEAVTHDIQISVMRSAKLADVADFQSEVVKMGKRICFIDVKVTVSGEIIASARVTKSIRQVRQQ